MPFVGKSMLPRQPMLYKWMKNNAKIRKKKLEGYRQKIEKFTSMGDPELAAGIQDLAERLEKELAALGGAQSMTWRDTIRALHASQDISTWMFDYYSDLNPQLFPKSEGSATLIELLLLREFAAARSGKIVWKP